jgi:DNA-binding winged helix-turn-helix (wHTH) protein
MTEIQNDNQHLGQEPDYLFGPFRTSPDRLLREHIGVDIDPQPLALLRFLIGNRDRTVSIDELLQRFWKDVHVSKAVVHSTIKRLRDSLGESAHQPVYLESRGKHGYQFVGEVAESRHRKRTPDRFEHANGWFERQADGTWKEFPEYAPGWHFTFQEMTWDDEYLYLSDPSRKLDPGRPMILRLPIGGGTAQWSYPNPLDWSDFTIVWPALKK